MNILLLCNKSPYPPREGGPMAMNSVVSGLLEAGHKVKILAVNSEKYNVKEDDIPAEYREKTGIELVDFDLNVYIFPALKSLIKGESYHIRRFISDKMTEKIIEVLKADEYDIVQLETLFMCPYIETIREHSKARIVLRAHNIEHLIWKRIAQKTKFFAKRWYINQLTRTLREYELTAIGKVDGIAAITRKDATFFRANTIAPVIDIPFGVNPEEYEPKFEVNEKPSMFYIGSMNWMPNEEGVKWFIDSILPNVVKRIPDFKWRIAGRSMPEWLTTLNNPNIEIVGEVEDSKQFVRDNDIALIPLRSGSGIRVKIIEALAMGKAVITTDIGAEGIAYTEYENMIVASNNAKLEEGIFRLINNPQAAEELGRNARKLVEHTYDNRKIINRLILFYENIHPKREMTVI